METLSLDVQTLGGVTRQDGHYVRTDPPAAQSLSGPPQFRDELALLVYLAFRELGYVVGDVSTQDMGPAFPPTQGYDYEVRIYKPDWLAVGQQEKLLQRLTNRFHWYLGAHSRLRIGVSYADPVLDDGDDGSAGTLHPLVTAAS